MHKLTLDPSTQFGWCLLLDDDHLPQDQRRSVGQRLSYGTWDLTKDEDGKKCKTRAQYAWNLWAYFNALVRKHNIEGEDIEIWLEGESYASRRSEASRRLASAWLHTLEMMCERKGLPYPRECSPSEWRMSFIKCDKAPKEVGAGLKDDDRYAARRKWLKDRTLAECRAPGRNLKPKNDNEADALGMMFWLVNDGPEAQAQRKADKKAKAAAKRAQKKLDLQVAA